ncbi:hypothetical protein AN960_14755 [Bacillus sp. FJAT-25509]|uniref:hypothetical protein n=1 Tax=Bacillus sp. FJAT-25509 TaxID=1712029 RepID=UPI0006FE2AD7|nr:hypothetical protein [Bacillus sp. FJAT-25509]KQL38206.1 hypothetical protein AN960_14755 [Bacillus sp. FJAT-25509]
MNSKIDFKYDEHLLFTVTGLLDIFDGTQNIYFGDLYLTNKRLYIVSNKLLNLEKSFWFEGERREFEHSTFIVGEHRITVRWAYSGNLVSFINAFSKMNVKT